MYKKLSLLVALILVVSSIFLYSGFKFRQNVADTTKITQTGSEEPKNKTYPKTEEKPVAIRSVNIYLDSDFMMETKDIIEYGLYKSLLTSSGMNVVLQGYANQVKIDKNPVIQPNPDSLNLHFAVFGTMLDAYKKDSSIRWVGTAGRGIIGYGATSFGKDMLSSIKKVGLTGSGNDLKLLGNLFLADFGLNPSGKEFIETTSDSDKYKALDNKSVDLIFIKGNEANNSKKYTILEPISNNDYYPFRTMYTVGGIKDKEYLAKFIQAFDEVKKNILKNPEDFKDYIDKKGAPILKNVKDGYYAAIVASIKDLDTKPNKLQLKDSIGIYLTMKGMSEKNLNLDASISQ